MVKSSKGYNLERYCIITLEYNGYHVKRNARSLGIEDIVAFNGIDILLIQVKNTLQKHNSLTKNEKQILKNHALELKAIPIFLYKNGRGKYIWFNLKTNLEIKTIIPYTKEWYRNRQIQRKILKRIMKQSKSIYNKYILENWDNIKNYIC